MVISVSTLVCYTCAHPTRDMSAMAATDRNESAIKGEPQFLLNQMSGFTGRASPAVGAVAKPSPSPGASHCRYFSFSSLSRSEADMSPMMNEKQKPAERQQRTMRPKAAP